MLQVQFIRDNKEEVIKQLQVRNVAASIIEEVISLDEERRALQAQLDNTLAESIKLSKEIGGYFKSGDVEKANELKAQTGTLKETSKSWERVLWVAGGECKALLLKLNHI